MARENAAAFGELASLLAEFASAYAEAADRLEVCPCCADSLLLKHSVLYAMARGSDGEEVLDTVEDALDEIEGEPDAAGEAGATIH